MAWTTISNALVAVGAKPFATTIQALRDNPIAIAEGAVNAPRVAAVAIAGRVSFITLSGTTPVDILNLDRAADLDIDFGMNPSASANLQVRFSNDNGATWGSYQSIATSISSGVTIVRGFVNMQTGAYATYKMRVVSTESLNSNSGTLTVPSDANAISIRSDTTGNGVGKVRVLGGVSP